MGLNTMCVMLVDGRPARLVRIEQRNMTGAYEVVDPRTNERFTLFPENLKMSTNIPARFKRHLFDGVAHVIGAALDAYPQAIEVDPSPLSVETFARRIREAIQSKQLYQYKHPSINDQLFTQRADELCTSIRTNKILVGPLASLKQNNMKVGKLSLTTPRMVQEVVVDVKNQDTLERICRLMHDRAFDPMPNFVVFGLTETQITDLENRYDIAFAAFEGQPNKFQIV